MFLRVAANQLCLVLLLLLSSSSVALAQQATPRSLVAEHVAAQTFHRPEGLHTAVVSAPSGELYSLAPRRREVHVISPATARSRHFSLLDAPAVRSASKLSFAQDLEVDAQGNVYVPATWRHRQGTSSFVSSAGVFVFSNVGTYMETVEFSPAVSLTEIARGDEGSFFVLGIDSAYFRHRADACLLIHKYSRTGQRLTAFSICPVAPDLRRPGDARLGPDFEKLRREVDRGDLWVEGGMVHHLLPVSQQLRIFDFDGALVKEIQLRPPSGSSEIPVASSDTVWKARPLPDGTIIVD